MACGNQTQGTAGLVGPREEQAGMSELGALSSRRLARVKWKWLGSLVPAKGSHSFSQALGRNSVLGSEPAGWTQLTRELRKLAQAAHCRPGMQQTWSRAGQGLLDVPPQQILRKDRGTGQFLGDLRRESVPSLWNPGESMKPMMAEK